MKKHAVHQNYSYTYTVGAVYPREIICSDVNLTVTYLSIYAYLNKLRVHISLYASILTELHGKRPFI
jgi:hypothetical protein